jgi:hypothetical protein
VKKEDVIPGLLRNCPSFEDVWNQCDDEERELLYSRFGDLARHLLEKKREGRDDVLATAGIFIERMHVEGDAYVRELATIGALEGIQNVWGHAGEDEQAFRPYLGAESVRWWDSLSKFWRGEIPLVGSDLGEANERVEATPVTPPENREPRSQTGARRGAPHA